MEQKLEPNKWNTWFVFLILGYLFASVCFNQYFGLVQQKKGKMAMDKVNKNRQSLFGPLLEKKKLKVLNLHHINDSVPHLIQGEIRSA